MPHDTQKYKFPIISILTKNEIRQFVLLVVLVGVTAMLELVSVAAVIPFVSVIIDDALLQQQALTRPVSDWLNQLGLSKNDKVALLSCAFALSFSLACGFRLLAQYLQTKFILNCEKSLSARLLKIYLHKTFASLVGLTASDISASILANVSAVASGVIQPLVTCIAQITVVIVLVTFLLIYDYASTIGVLALVVTTYGFIFKFSGKWLRDAGRGKVEANRRRYSEVATAFSSVRNLKSERMEDVFYSRFLNSAGQYAKKLTMQQFAAFAPRYFVEALLVIATVLVTLANLGESANGLGEMLPKYAAFLMAGYRIAPAMQQIYAATSNMNFNASVLMEIQKLLQNETPAYTAANPTPKFPLSSEIINIEITDLSFRFRQESKFVLKGLNVKLDGRGLIGVMGPSGAGKTTLIDILLGLLPPTEGSVKIGGVDLSLLSNLHTLIGLVPQDLWLFEGTIADNVSLGQSEEIKNIDRMREVIRQVGLEAFVEELPRGYQTQVGDRGQLLSGGQRQRIAIARALYKQPQILILDEPTSALDAESEAEVIQTLSAISRRMLVLVISHRRSPLLACDRVIEIRNGSIFRDASKTETEDGYLFLT